MKNLKTSEKRLLIILLAAAIGGGYFFLIHENLERSILDAESRILDETIEYENKNRKISELPELRAYLQELEDLPDYSEIFFPATLQQERFMEIIHNIIVDNELLVESIMFSRRQIFLYKIEELMLFRELVRAGEKEWDQWTRPTPREEGIWPYLNKIGAEMTFFLEFTDVENLLNVLDTIEQYPRMIVCPELLVFPVEAHRVPPPLRTEAIEQMVENPDEENLYPILRCVTRFDFVSFIDVYDQDGWEEYADMDNVLSEETEVHWEY